MEVELEPAGAHMKAQPETSAHAAYVVFAGAFRDAPSFGRLANASRTAAVMIIVKMVQASGRRRRKVDSPEHGGSSAEL